MGYIHVLDSETIDKIAAGEVVEKPASVVKELLENAIDAGADKITVEIKDGGISFIRVTDNGCGIAKEDLANAFMRHATSKIEKAEDLEHIVSLGFRGEALSSISAVSQVEMITKTEYDLLGYKIACNGGVLEEPEEIGAPDGTTILVRNLFYNTPARKKFLHASMTEGSYVAELMQRIAMSHPDIAITYIQNGQTKFFTSGNGALSEIIYRIYGKDVSENMVPIQAEKDGIQITGYIGKPILARANRNYETFFINGRFVKSKVISTALEEGYRSFLMQHKYPFAVLHFTFSGQDIDVNVHPTKTEVRIMNPMPFCSFLQDTVRTTLSGQILMPAYAENDRRESREQQNKEEQNTEFRENKQSVERTEGAEVYAASYKDRENSNNIIKSEKHFPPEPFEVNRAVQEEIPMGFKILGNPERKKTTPYRGSEYGPGQDEQPVMGKAEQMELFAEGLNRADSTRLDSLRIVGQIFRTYWIVEFENNIYFVDQHAAHEKVNYENWLKRIARKETTTQMLMPAQIITVSPREKVTIKQYQEVFEELGFDLQLFGGSEIVLRGVPQDLYGCNEEEMFKGVLDELMMKPPKGTPETILAKVASMSCKAAVKGNQGISLMEAKALLKQLFSLENPYHCPHGRPTMFSMSKYDVEKKFKRVL
ncbi:MAG: DNA mismatch repair endonuclease MutL [Lachnospiraceae bacterium]|nr:DNA mismatch repair endonuclease MutL [Lachnospiraceae bacterium]